jgi:hypothetical protein
MIPPMPRKDWSVRLDRATFRCGRCRGTFTAIPDLVDDDPENPAHPFRYFAKCPDCGAENVPQASWERALMAAHQAATGPVTAEGKAAAAANLAGHPTPEESRLIRFNAMKHGMEARTASYFPARPGKYAFCDRCEVDRGYCAGQPACVKQTEIFMLHHAAMDQRDPKVLGKIHADLMAALTATLQLCMQSVLGRGVEICTPRVELSREGVPVTLTYRDAAGEQQTVYEINANPLFKPMTDLITRLGLTMNDLGLTVKASEEDDLAGKGTLTLAGGSSKEGLEDFSRRTALAMQGMREQLGRAQARMRSDPVLIEHEAQGDGE